MKTMSKIVITQNSRKFAASAQYVFIFLLWMISLASCQITPPPEIDDSPVIANNRIYFLKHIPQKCRPPIIDTFAGGGLIKDPRALLKRDNPHIIRGMIEIAPTGCLYIEPGTVMKFAPGIGMIVNGTLIARGSEIPGGRITMTKADGEDLGKPSGDWQDDARLVMGNTTRDGRLDLKLRGAWRAVCTNYNNFTAIDANVTCRHLGFLKGNFTYHSFSRNLTDYILWEKPDCKGSENSLFDCPGAIDIKTGRHICDGQEVVGFQCEGLRPNLALDHWRGIDFYNSSTEFRYQIQNNTRVYMEESLSFLEYLDISYTGLDTYHGQTPEVDVFYQKAAISASPHVPMINNVTIKYGAYDALNLTEIRGPIHIANSTISLNRGYGMFIQSSVGRCLVNMTEVNHNWGDGIKFYLSNLTIFDFRLKFPPSKSMCAVGNTNEVTYPFYQHMDLVQVNGNDRSMVSVGGHCERVYTTSIDMRITVHFMIIERDPEATGQFIFSDGSRLAEPIATIPIENGSFPQSITTKTNRLYVRFEYDQPRNMICKKLPSCIRFLLEYTSDYDVEEEFRLIMSNVHDNIGYGVNIQDMRSKVRISNETIIAYNQFGAGVHVYKGAGDIVINGTRIEGNADAGINITYSGGYQLLNNTELIANKGYGVITEYLKLNRTRIEARNKIEVVRAKFLWNELIGLRMGNYCLGGDVHVNESYFAYNHDEAIEYLSCNVSTMYKTKFKVDFNTFNDNFRHAIFMRPLLNTEGIITNNTFANHSLGTIRIDNGYDLLISRWYRDFPVDLNIFENEFVENMGRYVLKLRLTQYSAVQKIYCKFNYFERNEINDSFQYLNPRSKANAVVILSSSNVLFKRNYIDNPLSVREVATHLVDPSLKIDARENYWGTEINTQADYEKVYNAIFDQDDRYNLAQILYHPALKTLRLYENILSDDVAEYVWNFQRGENIGGVLESRYFIVGQGRTYYVDKDIYIFPDKTLLMEPNSKLKFAPSVGMVVHGILRADGMRFESQVTFDLDDREEFVPMENRTASIRLVDGYDEFEGRLEVEIEGQWGTVCNDGWIEENSLLACQQLGLVFNRENPEARLKFKAPLNMPVLMSWVSCDDLDVDLTKCRAVNSDASTCGHDKDVYLRCQPPTWAGITLAAAYRHDQNQPQQKESQIRFAKINNAGLLDSDTATVTPALRIDYNYYQISWLTVYNSMSDGIHISYCHPYTFNKMEYITVLKSAGHGLLTRSPKLEVMHSRFDNNEKAGFIYDPFFTEYDALLIRNMIYPERRIDMFAQLQRIVQGLNTIMFLICQTGHGIEQRDYFVEVKASSSSYKLAVQILDYLPVENAEKVTVYDSNKAGMSSPNTKKWEIEKDLVDFPILSSSSVITIHLKLNGQLSGRLAFAIITRNYDSGIPQLRTAVTNTTFNANDQGVVTKHYNNPSNKRLELFHRHRVEQIYFKDVKITNSARHGMHMPSVTKFHEDYIPTYEDMTAPERVAKIIYTVFHTRFLNNAVAILAEHNHVDFANNVWQWRIDHVTIDGNQKGGLEIEVPRVNDESEREIHAVHVMDSYFQNNKDFAFSIAGYYADVKVDRNAFTNNQCLLGLVSITGMEKNLTVNSNSIKNNNCRFMVDIDIHSHSEYYTTVRGQMDLNEVIANRYDGTEPPGSAYSPKTYAVAVKGLQNITANRNLFSNPSLGYEMIAGITSLTLGNPVDVTRNYWGVTDESSIRRRIFDFDDWNNYAIAEYFPYLTLPDRNSTPATGVKQEILLGQSYLGGRVEKSQILVEIGKPYIVQSDLTVMPGITLTVPPGTELQFRPNVGILVLGRLVADGLPYSRIKFRPLQSNMDPLISGRKRRELLTSERPKRNSPSSNIRLRGDETLFKNAGFLELYNASSKSWNMMCDSQFNEKTAEVVCRELGKEVINVKVRFTHLFDYYIFGKPMYFRKEFWFNSYHCRGDETSLSQCITRYNYNLLPCIVAANYTFITCGERNLEADQEYWGNIRFASDTIEEEPLEADIGVDRSIMRYVDIEGAGMLHGEKVGAIQTTYVTPIFKHINITKCAENGYDIIAPRQNLDIQYQNISGNLGYAINVLVLNGESSDRRSSFLPNSPSTIPYYVHGLVDICKLEKEIFLETRMILYYKYGPYNKDCVKIISSRKIVGLRFLQINLFHEDFSRNVVEIFDGKDVNENSRIANIMANSSTEAIQNIYKSTGPSLAVHVHASVSHGMYGFIAEVVKLPLAGLTYPNSDFSHSVQQAEIRKNEDGAIQYKNVGETNPNLFIEHCWMAENGYPILNLTSPPTIDISLQSTISFRFSHNQVSYNHGGMYLFAHTSLITTALKGNLTNNVFSFGTNGEALNISGHYFERLMFHQNYIYNYTAGDYRDVVHIKDVVVNLTHNYILKNIGHNIIHTYNNDDSTDPQIFVRNGIYDNNATALREATIKIGQGRPKFTNNFLVNSLNDFEMESYPKSPVYTRNIDAKNNWWGSERQAFINGKTYDYSDDKDLVKVDFWPPILDNRSMIEGNCLPGWVLDKNRCYRYMGGALPFEEAKEFCQSHGAFLAEARDRESFFNYLIRLLVIEQDWAQRVWVMSEVGSGRCAAFEKNYIVSERECNRRYYPFICETDPDVRAPEELTSAVKAMIIGISVGVGSIILIIIAVIVILWCIKSKRREKERFERTASIRSSLNNLTKINSSLRGTKSTLTVMSEGASRRRLNELDDERSVVSSTAKYSQGSAISNGTDGSVHSLSSGYVVTLNPEPAPPQRNNTRPVHSLRPERSATGRPIQNTTNDRTKVREREDRERERERRRKEEKRRRHQFRRDEDDERGKHLEDSDDDSVEKEDFEDDSSFEEESDEQENRGEDQDSIDARNMQYHVNRSNERLFQQPAGQPGLPPLLPAASGRGDERDLQDNPYKSKSFSSFTDPIDSPAKNIHFPPRITRRDDTSTPPPDSRRLQSSPELDQPSPKPAPRPKPLPPARTRTDNFRPSVASASSDRSYGSHRPAPVPRQKNMGSQEHLYNNDQGPATPLYDPVYDAKPKNRFPLYNNMKDSDQGSSRGPLHDPVYDDQSTKSSQGFPHYDPVYDKKSSDRSRSTDRYEPIEYNSQAGTPYGLDQVPDTDYMPRPLGNPALGRSREGLGAPPSASKPSGYRGHLESNIDSPPPSTPSDTDYLPYHSRFDDSLPPKPGASDSRSYPSVASQDGGDSQYMPSMPRPPPYTSSERFAQDRPRSTDRLDYMRGSREHLHEEPPPYSPGGELMPRRHAESTDVLYLNQGGRSKSQDPIETEI